MRSTIIWEDDDFPLDIGKLLLDCLRVLAFLIPQNRILSDFNNLGEEAASGGCDHHERQLRTATRLA
jgi:hypothetical protein